MANSARRWLTVNRRDPWLFDRPTHRSRALSTRTVRSRVVWFRENTAPFADISSRWSLASRPTDRPSVTRSRDAQRTWGGGDEHRLTSVGSGPEPKRPTFACQMKVVVRCTLSVFRVVRFSVQVIRHNIPFNQSITRVALVAELRQAEHSQ